MRVEDSEMVYNRMSGIARMVYELAPNFDVAGYILLALIFIMSAIVYKLGFAKKISFWQNAVIYTFLFIGCLVLTFLAFFLPIVEGLIVAAAILIIYRVRRMNEYKKDSAVQ
ncbi:MULTISPECIES: YlaH-like family protein [Sporosarcina]|uniref:YlaH-like family protein n=1 Tax=Sporosarcina TaxID=1569 RepID=UPI0035E40416